MVTLDSRMLDISQLPAPTCDVLASDRILAMERARQTSQKWRVYRSDAHFDETATMSLFLYPYAPAERVEIAILFNTIGFFFDDAMGHDKHEGALQLDKGLFVAKLKKALSDPAHLQIDTNDLLTAQMLSVAGDFVQLVYSQSNLDFTKRFRDSTLQHWHTSFDIADQYTSLKDFILIRRQTGGMFPTMDMIEFAYDRYLPAPLYNLPKVQEALNALADIGGLSNEIFSYPKEVMEQGAKLNFVSVIQHIYQCDLETAVCNAIEYVNQRTQDFNGYCDALLDEAATMPSDESDLMRWYVGAMQDMAWASYAWQMYTERYNHPRHVFGDKRAERHFQERFNNVLEPA
jgi:hypothetical protein